jgi:nicotinamide mononucleotide transporter
MQAILNFLNSPIGLLFGMSTSLAEIIGFVTGALAVYLVAVDNIWTWPVGILNAVFFFILFIEAHLYTDAWLQLFFVASCVFGWIAWLRAGPNRTALHVRRAPIPLLGFAAVAIGIFIYFMIPVLRTAHGAYPAADSTTTGLSVAAQLIMGLKMIENWALWIMADLIYIPVYALKGLYFTSFLYVIFLLICFKGVAYWRNALIEQRKAEGIRAVASEVGPPVGIRPAVPQRVVHPKVVETR